MQDKNIDLSNFVFLVSRPETIQRDEMFYELFESYRDLSMPRVIAIPLDGINRAMYIDKGILSKTIQYLADLVSTRSGYEKHLADFVKLQEKYAQVGKEFLSLESDKAGLASAYQKFIAAVKGLSDFAWMPFTVERLLAPRLLTLLERDFQVKAHEMHSVISSPIKLNAFQQMRVEICDSVIKEVPLKKTVKKLVEKYFWYNEYSFVEELCDEKFFEKEINVLDKVLAQTEKDGMLSEIEKNEKLLKTVRAQIADDGILLLADVVNEYTYLRAERIDLLKRLQAPTRHLFALIADHLKKDTREAWVREDVANMLSREINDYLSGGDVPDFKKVHDRNRVIYFRDPVRSEIISDPSRIDEIATKLQISGSKIIKGAVAFKGKILGKVVLVFSKQDLHKVTLGSVLVARTTMPDYTPAMKMACAFVTEEGGITSHAAIIARELKKPCIVGTGNCTKLLHDGDEVEVDATSGVVKILKKA